MADPLTDLINGVKCPINIFQNIDVCGYYYIEDILLILIYWIVWLFFYIFLFIPIYLSAACLCLCVKTQLFEMTGFDSCVIISSADICPSKQFLSILIEKMVATPLGRRVFARDGGDMDKCYCNSAVEKLFDPLREDDINFEEIMKEQQSKVVNSLINGAIGFGIIGVLALIAIPSYFAFMKLYSKE